MLLLMDIQSCCVTKPQKFMWKDSHLICILYEGFVQKNPLICVKEIHNLVHYIFVLIINITKASSQNWFFGLKLHCFVTKYKAIIFIECNYKILYKKKC